uniref:Uncharacterized protein n=1 Tax=Rhizophora mucronata TaxID=61149 RepID=A0A2P2NCS8_RHIMU
MHICMHFYPPYIIQEYIVSLRCCNSHA